MLTLITAAQDHAHLDVAAACPPALMTGEEAAGYAGGGDDEDGDEGEVRVQAPCS
jgi:hypothetical protein